ncbi:MAG: hypothetical protein K2X31_06455 [Sphingopyxis sp.]|nr:hypothetical protein [Sphingopyxis sp.]
MSAKPLRRCFRQPISEIFHAATQLMQAVEAHLAGAREQCARLIADADKPEIAAWTDSLWGKQRPDIHRFRTLPDSPPAFAVTERPIPRMPNTAVQRSVIARDGYHCRFCGIPVIPRFVRAAMSKDYPEARWGTRNIDQHAALQCMWLQFDHCLPNKRGGDSSQANIIITCAPCNFARMDWTIAEAGLEDPRDRYPEPSWSGFDSWIGLTNYRPFAKLDFPNQIG